MDEAGYGSSHEVMGSRYRDLHASLAEHPGVRPCFCGEPALVTLIQCLLLPVGLMGRHITEIEHLGPCPLTGHELNSLCTSH